MIYGNGLMLITNYVQNLFGYSPEYSVLPSETLERLYLTIQWRFIYRSSILCSVTSCYTLWSVVAVEQSKNISLSKHLKCIILHVNTHI